MVYIKEAEKISDFLRVINAYEGVMYFEDIRIYRDHKNMTNRLNNCEQANIDKIFLTASNQLKDIEKLKQYDLLDVIDQKLKEVVEYRTNLNHRFRKIKEMVSHLDDKKVYDENT